MKNKYVIVLGIACLFSALMGILFQDKKYYYIGYNTKKEVSAHRFERFPDSDKYVCEKKIDVSLMVLSFVAAFGGGVIITSISNRSKRLTVNNLFGDVNHVDPNNLKPIETTLSKEHFVDTTNEVYKLASSYIKLSRQLERLIIHGGSQSELTSTRNSKDYIESTLLRALYLVSSKKSPNSESPLKFIQVFWDRIKGVKT